MRGFSLLEVLIALALASIFILAADFSLSKAIATNTHVSHIYAELFGG